MVVAPTRVVSGPPSVGPLGSILSSLLSHVEKYSIYIWNLLCNKICSSLFYTEAINNILDMQKCDIFTTNTHLGVVAEPTPTAWISLDKSGVVDGDRVFPPSDTRHPY